VEDINQEWLKTAEGRAWLETDEGMAWWRSTEGQRWSHSEDANRWYDELAQRGWERYFAGEMPGPPEWAITPETAPQVASWIRLTEPVTTLGGVDTEADERAFVTEVKYNPMQAVFVTVRTPDGRSRFVIRHDEFTTE
jgi:hypothetical protein